MGEIPVLECTTADRDPGYAYKARVVDTSFIHDLGNPLSLYARVLFTIDMIFRLLKHKIWLILWILEPCISRYHILPWCLS